MKRKTLLIKYNFINSIGKQIKPAFLQETPQNLIIALQKQRRKY